MMRHVVPAKEGISLAAARPVENFTDRGGAWTPLAGATK